MAVYLLEQAQEQVTCQSGPDAPHIALSPKLIVLSPDHTHIDASLA